MAKIRCAVFGSRTLVRTEADGTKVYQPSVTVVAETSATKRFTGVTFCYESSLVNAVVTKVTAPAAISDSEFEDIIKNLISVSSFVYSKGAGFSQASDVELLTKLDEVFKDNNYSKRFANPYVLGSKDTNGLKLIDFLKQNYSFDPANIFDFKINKSITRKYALPKKTHDWDLFWNSNVITDAEKSYCRGKIDLDICMSNVDKDIYKVFNRTVSADYPERTWTLNILFGDPSSGKTTMIQNWCCLNGAPLVKLTGDPTISMVKLIMTVGPEAKVLTKADIISKLKSLGLSDSDISLYDSQIVSAVIDYASGKVELTEQESIILKCIKNHLPCVVLLDEINMFTTLLQATLADVITSGHVNVGVHTYKTNPSDIIWFGAYNPDTYKASPFEGKFRDRALFFCSEMPSLDDLVSHKQRKVSAKMFGCSNVLASLEERVEELKGEHPELAQKFDSIYSSVSLITQSTMPSSKAVEWYFNYEVDKLLGNNTLSFDEGVFTDYYLSDVTPASPTTVEEAQSKIISYVSLVNEQLASLTKGIDTKNPDSNFAFYIPNRAVDYFTDLIFCFSSVEAATHFFIYNLIPNGGTCRYATSLNPAKDIADTVCTTLKDKIDELQTWLFTDFDPAIIHQKVLDMFSNMYDAALWTPVTAVNSNGIDDADTQSSDDAEVKKNVDILDEAELL